jgi:hypothetical protein
MSWLGDFLLLIATVIFCAPRTAHSHNWHGQIKEHIQRGIERGGTIGRGGPLEVLHSGAAPRDNMAISRPNADGHNRVHGGRSSLGGKTWLHGGTGSRI